MDHSNIHFVMYLTNYIYPDATDTHKLAPKGAVSN